MTFHPLHEHLLGNQGFKPSSTRNQAAFHGPTLFSPLSMCSKVFPTLSSIRSSLYWFMYLDFMHLDLSFVQGDKNGSICILLHVEHHLTQHHLLKMLSFFHWMLLACKR